MTDVREVLEQKRSSYVTQLEDTRKRMAAFEAEWDKTKVQAHQLEGAVAALDAVLAELSAPYPLTN